MMKETDPSSDSRRHWPVAMRSAVEGLESEGYRLIGEWLTPEPSVTLTLHDLDHRTIKRVSVASDGSVRVAEELEKAA